MADLVHITSTSDLLRTPALVTNVWDEFTPALAPPALGEPASYEPLKEQEDSRIAVDDDDATYHEIFQTSVPSADAARSASIERTVAFEGARADRDDQMEWTPEMLGSGDDAYIFDSSDSYASEKRDTSSYTFGFPDPSSADEEMSEDTYAGNLEEGEHLREVVSASN